MPRKKLARTQGRRAERGSGGKWKTTSPPAFHEHETHVEMACIWAGLTCAPPPVQN